MTLDAGGDLILDADGTDIILKDGGTSFGSFKRASSDFIIKAEAQDKDILFKGNDGGSTVTALQLDMSEGGNAIFNGNVQVASGGFVFSPGALTLQSGTGTNLVLDAGAGADEITLSTSALTTTVPIIGTGDLDLYAGGGTKVLGLSTSTISLLKDTVLSGNISGSANTTGSFGKVVIPMQGNNVAFEALNGNFSVGNIIFEHSANAGNLQFGSQTAGMFHTGGKVRVRVDSGFSAGNEAFKAQDWPVAAGFWVDSSGNMQLGTGTSNGATVQMASLSTTGDFETSGSLIATTGNISGSATSTGSFGH